MIFVEVKNIIFKNKQNIPWNDVEVFLKGFIGIDVTVKKYGDIFLMSILNHVIRRSFEELLQKRKLMLHRLLLICLKMQIIDDGLKTRTANMIKKQMAVGIDMMWVLLYPWRITVMSLRIGIMPRL